MRCRITRRRAGFAAVAAIAAVLASACGGTSGGGQAARSAKPPSSSSASQAASSVGQPAAFHGIILGYPQSDGGVKLQAVNPTTGLVTTERQFTVPSGVTSTLYASAPGYVNAQAFTRDFTLLAASSSPDQNGAVSAGVINLQGTFHALTAGIGSGYGAKILQKYAKAINPFDGRLWYETKDANGDDTNSTTGSVDLKAGASSDRPEHPKPSIDSTVGTGFQQLAFFGPDGYGPIALIAATDNVVFLPNGTEVKPNDIAPYGYRIGPDGTVGVDAPEAKPTDNMAPPVLPVSANSFLAADDHQLYLETIGSSSVHGVPLLPQSDRTLDDFAFALSPDGSQVAFVSSTGDTHTLYTIPLHARSSEPTKVADLNVQGGTVFWLLGWR